MSIKKNLANSVAALSVAVTTAFTSASFVEPAQAQTISIPTPQSCRLLDNERQRIAREDNYAAQRSARDTGNAIRNGARRGDIDLGNIAGAIGGGLIERELSRGLRDNTYVRDLEYRCESEKQQLRDGYCTGRVSQNSSGTIVNGIPVGPSVGRVTESQNCVRTDIPHPSGGNMARDLNGASAYPQQGAAPNGYYQGQPPRGSYAPPVNNGGYDGSRRSGSARDRMSGSQGSPAGCFFQNGVKYCPTP
jgi:uncharacterized protein YcfJ